MVEFPTGYFEDEVRDGFYVNGFMKRCWAAQLEIINDIKTVCDKYDIKWYADCGTLLGAVRHGGFVPWDDDVDICMFREDYMKFISVADRELKSIWKGYKLLNFRNGDYWEVISRVVDMHAVNFDEERTSKFHGFPLEVGVDIFPLDYLCESREDEERRMTICNTIFSIADDERLYSPDKDILETLTLIELAAGHKFDRKKSLQMQLYEYGEKMFSLYDKKQAKYAALMGYWLKDESHRYDLKWYNNTVMLPFEIIKVPAPIGYDSVLKTEYGDYLRIDRTGGAHDYPRFERQINDLYKEMGDGSPFHKKVSKKDLDEAKKSRSNNNPRQAVKDKIVELNGLLKEAHAELDKLLSNNDIEAGIALLEDCQNTAIYIGTFIEENYGEGHVTVKCYEDYCELVYGLHEQLLSLLNEALDKVDESSVNDGTLDKQLQAIVESVDKNIIVPREVVFLPYKTSLWKYMKPVWEECSNQPGVNVYVIPIPYYEKNAVGEMVTEHYDGDMFPDEVKTIDYKTYSFRTHLPDVIYIQNPFDDDNLTFAVNPYHYAKNLRKYTKELIYIPPFVEEEIKEGDGRSYKAMNQYVLSPGVVYADKVLLQSENMKKMYLRKLTDFFGEDSEAFWESKLVPKPSVYIAAEAKSAKRDIDMPDKWRRMIVKSDGSARKLILYYTSVSGLAEYGDEMLCKIRQVLEVFKRNSEVILFWYHDRLIDTTISKYSPKLYEEYMKIVEGFKLEKYGIFASEEDVALALELADAYYGDSHWIIQKFRNNGLPVMIQNVRCVEND